MRLRRRSVASKRGVSLGSTALSLNRLLQCRTSGFPCLTVPHLVFHLNQVPPRVNGPEPEERPCASEVRPPAVAGSRTHDSVEGAYVLEVDGVRVSHS